MSERGVHVADGSGRENRDRKQSVYWELTDIQNGKENQETRRLGMQEAIGAKEAVSLLCIHEEERERERESIDPSTGRLTVS